VVTGDSHELVEDPALFPLASPKILWPPGFHKLGYTGLGHRFLSQVTQFKKSMTPSVTISMRQLGDLTPEVRVVIQ